ncbi:RepB DNA-primase [Methylophilus rhizosphaerae]|uniref:RepB DNA-primase n=1 Tax=Methylophilus rhizosphaerae TaxID=492660 RepID=A0A1G9CGU0_9PROT|nr:DUF5906 domain-containing protein [Methylophilus rhizosphaerae]SDK50883.1 RepB DNA-primase [Methylophilus rhizosphaerae]
MNYTTNAPTAATIASSHYDVAPPSVDTAEACKFLSILAPQAREFHTRTFDDHKPQNLALSRNLKVSNFPDSLKPLIELNHAGAGVFIVINEGGQQSRDITRVRAIFADTDGAPLEPLLVLKPHVIIKSSPGNYHVYWLVDDSFPLSRFTEIQTAIADKYETDRAVKDLPRVLRLPGFYHQKGTPFLVRMVESNLELPRYSIDQIINGLSLPLGVANSTINDEAPMGEIPRHIAALFPPGEVLGKQTIHTLPYTKENREMVLSAARAAWPDGIPDRDSFYQLGMPLASLVVVNDWPETVSREILDDVASKPAGANRGHNDSEWACYLVGTSTRYKNGEAFLGIGSLFRRATENGWLRPGTATEKLSGLARFGLITLGSKVGIVDLEQAKEASTLKPLNIYSRDDGGFLIQRAIAASNPQADSAKEFRSWWRAPQTNMFYGVELNPSGTTPGYLNIFRGLSVTSQQGSYPLIKSFIKDIVCAGSTEYFNYLWGWMAHLIQKPAEKPGVSILLLGGQGTGKGTFAAKIVGGLYAHHFLHLQSDAALTGTFNEALESSLVVFADEAFFSGDRRAANILKAVETESRLQINVKFQPGRQITSYHRIIAASNNTHAAYVEEDDRRKFVLRLSEARKGDFAYWRALDAEINGGGLEALAFDLQHHDLTDFEVRERPKSSELMRQKLASLDVVPKWWLDRLTDARPTKTALDWSGWVSSDVLFSDCIEWARSIGVAVRLPSLRDFVITLKTHCPLLTTKQQGTSNNRKRGFELPPIDQCRAAFEDVCGGEIDWEAAQ